jgi:TPR repeat protein
MKVLSVLLMGLIVLASSSFQDVSADQADEAYKTGLMYETGDGVPRDLAEANKWYKKAADQGNDLALNRLKNLEQKSLDDTDERLLPSQEAMESRTQKNNSQAEEAFIMGRKYYNGEGVTKDYFEALKWLKKAADQGNTDAQLIIGGMYFRGEGVTQDHIAALKWLTPVADKGDVRAQLIVGLMYHEGKGVPKDDAEAKKWFQKAAAQGDKAAIAQLKILQQRVSGNTRSTREAQELNDEKNSALEPLMSIADARNYYQPINGFDYAINPPMKLPDEERYLYLFGNIETLSGNTVICTLSQGRWGFDISKFKSFVPRQGAFVQAIGKIVSLQKGLTVIGKELFFVVIDPEFFVSDR